VPSETSRQTIERVLSVYEIGARLHRLRLRKKLGLKELGRHTGLSPSLLSQLENGKMIPTLQTLARIAMVFDVGLDHFFEKRSRRAISIVRATERIRFPDRPDSPSPSFFFECLNYAAQSGSLQAYLAEFPLRAPREETGHFHEGAELIHVLDGVLVLRFGGEDHRLAPGDSACFDGLEPHSYRGVSRKRTRALVVTVPSRS
jgi:transcriptional regulator with XRE-family HTH domain